MSVKDEWGMQCPNCSDDSHLAVTVLADAMLSGDGTEVHGDHEWNDDSPCYCTACQWRGLVADAKAAHDMAGDGERAPFSPASMQSFRSHIADDWDAIFRVEVNGVSHAVFASRTPEGEWAQWGAARDALSAAVDITEEWARAAAELESANA